MRKWKPAIILLLTAVCVTACKSEEEDPVPVQRRTEPAPVNANTISTDFNANVFSSNIEVELLKELHLCDVAAPTDTDEKRPACSPNFFRFFGLKKGKPLKDGFMLLTKAGVNGFDRRRLLIFERENGVLVKLNGFVGNLIEKRPSPLGYDDIVVRFGERIEGYLYYYNCLFTWQQSRYEYQKCEAINDSRIKAELVDSMAIEIKKSLDANNFLF